MNDILEIEFEKFRKLYKGAKRGFITELNTLKKHRDWKQTIPLLVSAYESQLEWRDKAHKSGAFVPEHANLSTWINQRRWEMEMPEITVNEKSVIEAKKQDHNSTVYKEDPYKTYNPRG